MIKIYNCFHDHGSMPSNKYIKNIRYSLLCGADIEDRHTEDIVCDLRDNVGENISIENRQYSELTGYYWVWKNDTADIIGIEHYRRHFIKHLPVVYNCVMPNNLYDENDIETTLSEYDFIIPVHESLCNTNVYDLYVICFDKQADDIVKYMRNYFTENNMKNYLDSMYEYMSHNSLTRANMLITNKKNFDEYCTVMFGMIDYLKEHMPVKPESRVWGYVSELFPMIYLKANNKTFKEVDVAVDDFNQDLQKDVVYTTLNNKEEIFEKDPNEQIEYFKNL